MSRFAGVRNRRWGGSSPDPRIGPSRGGRPRLARTLQTIKGKNAICTKLQKIKEIVEISNVENIVQPSTSESEESVNVRWKGRPLSPDHVAEKVQKSPSTTSLINSETSSGLTMPSNLSSVSPASSYDASDLLDSSDAQSYYSSPETVRGFDPFDESVCESAADLPDQTRWKKKNSTLLEISKAMPINELIVPADISMISPITKVSSLDPNKSRLSQWQNSQKHLVSTFVSGKPLCKFKRKGKNTAKERSSPLPGAMSTIENLLTLTPQEMDKAKKMVTFGSPLATVIPRTEITNENEENEEEEENFCFHMDTETIPTRAELSLLLKKLSEKSTGMFIHHPIIRLLSKSGKNVCKEPCTPREQCCSPTVKPRVLNKRPKK